ncbi:Gfo/Idh/MocA family protein [Lysobacter korlensis]|uniref:Gfo/Idh/MocA family protein n=1 Tax=Lysobacter korlensis TaxID=553636 RepID=A0ABV6RSV3_9GAMM
MQIRYQFEHERRLRCGFVGAGGHSFRNIYPSLLYAPVDLRAVCDLDASRAAEYARMFGAGAVYSDHLEMLRSEELDAVFLVTAYDQDGDVQATSIAEQCLRAGLNVWMEKPTASSLGGLERLRAAERETGRFVMTGLKKMFTPAMEKVKSIITSEEFGFPTSLFVRYPQDLPPLEERNDPVRMLWFLDHIYHPAAILGFLGGPITRMSYEWEPRSGATVTNLLFASGAVGALHLTAGQAGTSPLERVEVVGQGANVVVENGVRVVYYRPGADRGYGRESSFVVDDAVAPLLWEPEFSLGQLYNKNLFYLGYVPEILHFCANALAGTFPQKGTLADAARIIVLYDAYRTTPPGVTVSLPTVTLD